MKLLIFVLVTFGSALGADWDYSSGSHGPSHWDGDCNVDSKTSQSPIDITGAEVTDLGKFSFKSYGKTDVVLSNNGHSVAASLSSDVAAEISGGDLDGTYKLAQFHFHWGSTDSKGSEHTLNGKQYPMEIHFVHYNTKYSDLSSAVDKSDGLAVLGFFFEIGNENGDYKDIVSGLSNVKYTSGTHSLPKLNLKNLLGKTKIFYRYAGGLTTPPCYESVTWTVFKEPIQISSSQMAAFRQVYAGTSSSAGVIVDNFRPVLPVGSRTIYSNTAASIKHNALVGMLIMCIASLAVSS